MCLPPIRPYEGDGRGARVLLPLSGGTEIMRRAYKHLVLVALVSLFVGLGMTASYQESSPAQTADPQPNIVFILTDDMRKDDLNTYMPKTTTKLVTKGMGFENAFVSNALCCPSRATIMRGQYAHNTDVCFNENVFDPDPNVHDGGWEGYNGNGYESENVATRLDAAGYRTALIGKYLNGYKDTTYVPRDGTIGSSLGGSTSTTTPTITAP